MFSSFIAHLGSSIYDPAFYARIMHGQRMRTTSFMFLFASIVSIVTVVFTLPGLFSIKDGAAHFPDTVARAIPEGLVLTMNNGVLTTNQDPQAIMIGTFPAKDPATSGAVAVIDTTTPYSLEAHKKSGALIWIGSEEAVSFKNDQGTELQRVNYKEVAGAREATFSVTQAEIVSLAEKISHAAGFVVPVGVALLLFVYIGLTMSGMLFSGIFIGFVLFIMSKFIQPKGWRCIPCIRAAIFAGVLPTLLGQLAWVLGFSFSGSLYALVVLAIILINLREVPTV